MRSAILAAACLVLPACGASRGIFVPSAMPAPHAAEGGGYGYGRDPYRDYGGDPSAPRAYVGVSVIRSFEQFDPLPVQPVSTDYGDALGIGIRGGCRFSKWFAAEAVVERGLGHEVKLSLGGNSATLDDEIETLSMGLQGKLYLLHEEVQPYLVGGFGLAATELGPLDDSSVYLRIGAGVDFPLGESTALFLEGTWNSGVEIEGVDLDRADVQLGLLFWF